MQRANQQRIITQPTHLPEVQEPETIVSNGVNHESEPETVVEEMSTGENFCITRAVATLMLKLKAEKNVKPSALNLIATGLEEKIRNEYSLEMRSPKLLVIHFIN